MQFHYYWLLSLCVDLFTLTLLLQFKRFNRELITELERKTDMDIKYMNVSIAWFSLHQSNNMSYSLTCASRDISLVWYYNPSRPLSKDTSQNTNWSKTSWTNHRLTWRNCAGKVKGSIRLSMSSKKMRWGFEIWNLSVEVFSVW